MRITTKKKYMLVEPSKGMKFLEIMEGIAKLFSMPEFKDKNDIWVFREGQIELVYNDLYKIKDSAEKLYPKGTRGKKTAIVAETGVQQSLAILYCDISKDLPRKLKVFSELKSAEDWIKK